MKLLKIMSTFFFFIEDILENIKSKTDVLFEILSVVICRRISI